MSNTDSSRKEAWGGQELAGKPTASPFAADNVQDLEGGNAALKGNSCVSTPKTQLDHSEVGSVSMGIAKERSATAFKGASSMKWDDDDFGTAHPKKKKALQRVKSIDAFALKEKPSTIAGGIITACIIIGLIAYTVYVVLAYMNRSWTKTALNQWTYNSGPWPLHLRCRAASGCYVSNKVTTQWSALTLNPTQAQCNYLAPGDWTTFDTVYSNNPNEGVSVIFIPDASNTTGLPASSMPQSDFVPSNFGMEIESTVVCPFNVSGCSNDDTLSLLTPVAGGLNLLFLVETTNNSASGAGFFRREWYPTQIANLNNKLDTSVVAPATSCDPSLFNSSWAHSRIRLNAEYVQLTVDRDALWLVVWGSVGGALGLFMQIGAVVLGVISIIMSMIERRRNRGVSDGSMTASMNVSSSPSQRF